MKSEVDIKVIIDKAAKDKLFRRELVKTSFFWFLSVYFVDYLSYPVANFQKEIVNLLENEEDTTVIAAFRGSGKSTIVSLAYVIWSMIGIKNKKFIVLISNTSRQTEMLMSNVKSILETNQVLKHDLGPFYEESEKWNTSSLIFKNYDTKIMAVSMNESIRGIRYKKSRPDLIICDDVETLDTARNKENREKVLLWFDRDIVPLGDEKSNVIVIGTIMTEGSLIQTLKSRIENNEMKGTFKMYPIVNQNGQIIWKERWKTIEDLEEYKKKKGILLRSWETEYLLNDWTEEDQIIKSEMIHYYDEIPLGKYNLIGGFCGVDLAISKNSNANKTAIISAYMFEENNQKILYILPYPTNKRLNFAETVNVVLVLVNTLETKKSTYVYAENVGYQGAFIESLIQNGLNNAKPFEVKGNDKVTRLETTLHNLIQGRIRFPKKGCEDLILQLTRFGYEKYDDLADAFSIVCIKAFEEISKINNPVLVKSNFRDGIISRTTGIDWAEKEDDEMFRNLNKRRRRI